MTAFDKKEGETWLSSELLKFGHYCVVFKNSQAFHDRLREAVAMQGKRMDFSHVEYYPQGYRGQIGYFRKRDKYQAEQEYRFLIENDSDAALTIRLGPLYDIAELIHFRGGS